MLLRLTLDDVQVEIVRSWEVDEKTRLLISAKNNHTEIPTTDAEGHIKIRDDQRKSAEYAIESYASLVAIAGQYKRSISSPIPCVAFELENDDDRSFFENNTIIEARMNTIPSPDCCFQQNPNNHQSLGDRLDGVRLLAEAFAHDNMTGRLHELIRLFELAFCSSGTKLTAPLAEFLGNSEYGYSNEEIKKWIFNLRDPATHADKKAFILESDVRPYVPRMLQAAYDVLFNKVEWHDISPKRRFMWKPNLGIAGNGGIVIPHGTTPSIAFQINDEFNAYPVDLSAGIGKNMLPSNWWIQESPTFHTKISNLSVV
jgi:hypothetical protein